MNYELRTKNKKHGFTLIEIMVAISIFSMVMVVIIGALLLLNDANKKAQALRAVVDNMNFAMEDMTRNIRTGRDYKCDIEVAGGVPRIVSDSCDSSNGDDGIVVKGPTNSARNQATCYLYKFKQADTTHPGSIGYSKKIVSGDDTCESGNAFPPVSNLVSSEVNIKNAKYYVMQGVGQQPIVIISINGEFNTSYLGQKFATPFDIQTTVSQRGDVQ